jgi:thiosulfate dehydrogenase
VRDPPGADTVGGRSSSLTRRALTHRTPGAAARHPTQARALVALLAVVALAGCTPRTDAPRSHNAPAAALDAQGAHGPMPFRVPADTELADSALRAAARRGLAIARFTRDSLPANVGAALACVSCHPGDGTRANGMPWVGVTARYPRYNGRRGAVVTLEGRIDECFERSMNGRRLAPDSPAMRDLVAYMTALSAGVPVGRAVVGQGAPHLPPLPSDTVRGATVYLAECARCHGAGGDGGGAAPPLWGARSFNVGAGMTMAPVMAAFVRANMPGDRPGTLTNQQATDVAAYVASRPRPDFARKADDWPHGDAPPFAPYATRARGGR